MKQFLKLLVCVLIISVSNSAHAKKIGILSALPQEQEELKSKIVNGKIGTHDVVLSLSGMGKVNAAAMAQRLISENKVEIIIFTGVAGGINTQYNIGDVVIVSRAFQHDVGFWGDAFVLHSPGILPEIGIGTGQEPFFIDSTKIPLFISAVKRLKKFNKKLDKVIVNEKEYQPLLYTKGTVATGDQFIANDPKKESLRELGADLVEMEGAAVAQVAKQNQIPFLIIRSISDKAGEKAHVDFSKLFSTVAKNNSNLVEFLLQNEKL